MQFQFPESSSLLAGKTLIFKKEKEYFSIVFLTVYLLGCTAALFAPIAGIIYGKMKGEGILLALLILSVTSSILWIYVWHIRGYEKMEFTSDSILLSYEGSLFRRKRSWPISEIKEIGILEDRHYGGLFSPMLTVQQGHAYIELHRGKRIYFGQQMGSASIEWHFNNP